MTDKVTGDMRTAIEIFKADKRILAVVIAGDRIQTIKNKNEKIIIDGKLYDRKQFQMLLKEADPKPFRQTLRGLVNWRAENGLIAGSEKTMGLAEFLAMEARQERGLPPLPDESTGEEDPAKGKGRPDSTGDKKLESPPDASGPTE